MQSFDNVLKPLSYISIHVTGVEDKVQLLTFCTPLQLVRVRTIVWG